MGTTGTFLVKAFRVLGRWVAVRNRGLGPGLSLHGSSILGSWAPWDPLLNDTHTTPLASTLQRRRSLQTSLRKYHLMPTITNSHTGPTALALLGNIAKDLCRPGHGLPSHCQELPTQKIRNIDPSKAAGLEIACRQGKGS